MEEKILNEGSHRLKEVKERLNLSNQELADALQVGLTACSKYLNGKSSPSFLQYYNLKNTFNSLDLNWLISGEGQMLINYNGNDTPQVINIQAVIKGGKVQELKELELTTKNTDSYSMEANERLVSLIDQLVKDNDELKQKVIRLTK